MSRLQWQCLSIKVSEYNSGKYLLTEEKKILEKAGFEEDIEELMNI